MPQNIFPPFIHVDGNELHQMRVTAADCTYLTSKKSLLRGTYGPLVRLLRCGCIKIGKGRYILCDSHVKYRDDFHREKSVGEMYAHAAYLVTADCETYQGIQYPINYTTQED